MAAGTGHRHARRDRVLRPPLSGSSSVLDCPDPVAGGESASSLVLPHELGDINDDDLFDQHRLFCCPDGVASSWFA